MVTLYTTWLTNSTFCPQSDFMFFVMVIKNKMDFSLHSYLCLILHSRQSMLNIVLKDSLNILRFLIVFIKRAKTEMY